jgi:signal recognition particle subunit SRP54
MLDIVSDGFKAAKDKLKGKATLSEENIKIALEDVRTSLLEADVEYTVVKSFIRTVKNRAIGTEVDLKAGKGSNKMKVSAGDHFIQICQEELENLMGPEAHELTFPNNRPGKIMMVGLQGVGKTTTTGKLANFYKTKKNKKPLLVAADMYRPAAVEQLRVLGKNIDVPVFNIPEASPVEICKQAEAKAYELDCDLIIFDTAGRLTIDEDLMTELRDIKETSKPDQILLVCDSMMGQDAVTTAQNFHDQLAIDSFIMTKLDGDSRGGAALSIKHVTGKPISFIGTGEGFDSLEEFRPQGLASRILGLGDVVGLMKSFEDVATEDREEEAMRMLQGKFTYKDFYEQISMIQNMGPLKEIIAKLPMQNMIPKDAVVDDKELTRIKAMIDSMTRKERLTVSKIDESRAKRIAKGSGRTVKDVQELVKKFSQMKQMMGGLGKSMGMMGKVPGMGMMKNMNNMRKMAQQMMGGGGMPDMASLMGGMGGMPGMPGAGGGGQTKKVDRSKLKNKRKADRKNRKKNRKK